MNVPIKTSVREDHSVCIADIYANVVGGWGSGDYLQGQVGLIQGYQVQVMWHPERTNVSNNVL